MNATDNTRMIRRIEADAKAAEIVAREIRANRATMGYWVAKHHGEAIAAPYLRAWYNEIEHNL